MESFRLRDVDFKILVRNANVDIKEAVENVHLAFRGEVWAGDYLGSHQLNRWHLRPWTKWHYLWSENVEKERSLRILGTPVFGGQEIRN